MPDSSRCRWADVPLRSPLRRVTTPVEIDDRDGPPGRPARPPHRGAASDRRRRAPCGSASQRRRGAILLLATGLVLTLFGARLVELQAVRGETLAAEALDQRLRTRRSRPTAAPFSTTAASRLP